MKSRFQKGVTPVIAVILMLALTVASIGLLWSEIQDITGQAAGTVQVLNDPGMEFASVRRNQSTNPDTIQVKFENVGEEQHNLSDKARLEYSIPGENKLTPFDPLFGKFKYNKSVSSCLDSPQLQRFASGEIAGCNTGVEMPSPSDDPITIYLVWSSTGSSTSVAEVTCSPSTSSSYTC